jgi:hypothetical protein
MSIGTVRAEILIGFRYPYIPVLGIIDPAPVRIEFIIKSLVRNTDTGTGLCGCSIV